MLIRCVVVFSPRRRCSCYRRRQAEASGTVRAVQFQQRPWRLPQVVLLPLLPQGTCLPPSPPLLLPFVGTCLRAACGFWNSFHLPPPPSWHYRFFSLLLSGICSVPFIILHSIYCDCCHIITIVGWAALPRPLPPARLALAALPTHQKASRGRSSPNTGCRDLPLFKRS